MRKEPFLLVMILVLVFVSGCTTNGGVSSSDDVLSLKFEIPKRTLPNRATELKIFLTNQGDKIIQDDIKNIKLRMSNPHSLTLTDVVCDFPGQADSNYCEYEKIQYHDEKEVTFRVHTPTLEELAEIGQYIEPEFVLEYDYWARSELFVPIVKEGKTTDASTKLTLSTSPIQIKIEKGTGVESKESGNWEREGAVFSIIVSIDDVNSPSEVIIEKDDFSIKLGHFTVFTEEGLGSCDFDVDGDTLKLKNDIVVAEADALGCDLKADEGFDGDWIPGLITAYVEYRYRLTKTTLFEVVTELRR